MFALAIFPPFLSPGATAVQTQLKQDPTSLGLVVLAGIELLESSVRRLTRGIYERK